MSQVPYNSKLINFVKERRNDSTLGERIVWSKLRNRQFHNIKFKRQVSILNYILDFYCPELKLCIEIDGMSHDELRYEKDIERENNLKQIGINILRFTEFEVKSRLDEVLETIYQEVISTSPLSSPILERKLKL